MKKRNQKGKCAPMRSRILFISGRHDDARQLSRMLGSLPVALEHVETYQQARTLLQQCDYDVLLTEAILPDAGWLDVLQLARELRSEEHTSELQSLRHLVCRLLLE